jgi:glucose/arabinose dehydrogenase
VTFVISNRGSSYDDFIVAGTRTRLLRPGRTATLTVDFSKAGSYVYRCATARRSGRLIAGSSTTDAAPPVPALTQIASGLGALTDVAVAPNDASRIFAVQQDGKVVMLDGGAQQVVADFGDDIRNDGENGLLDMTFSPQFAQDRTAYFYYVSDEGSGGDTLVSARWTTTGRST